MPAGWLSLDKGDNHVEQFWRYVIQALQGIETSLGKETDELLSSPQPPAPEMAITRLINDLAAFSKDLVLVLDDYHAITNPAIHDALLFFLEHLPGNVHLVIATRSDPPIPLARLRSRGQMVELRASDLRFTGDEAETLLNELMHLQLDADAVHRLTQRTEGWVTGLQMAALSLRNRADARSFIHAFSGTNRYILDYLLEEVLAIQPPEVQRFLLHTSILDQMCASLCDALMQGRETSISSSAMLRTLERENLFLVSLDDEAASGTGEGWFRYHHLFADLLRTRLRHSEPAMEKENHQRAANWFETQKMAVEAINHALAGDAHDQAARLVEENTTVLLARGELKALMGWVGVLPEKLRQARPWLCVHQAYALTFAGRLIEAEQLLRQAKIAGHSNDQPEDNPARLNGAILAVRAMAAVMSGRDIEAVQLANLAWEGLPETCAWDRAAAAWALGYAERSLGHLVEAKAAFEEMTRLARQMGNIWTLVTGLMDLANVVRTMGNLPQAQVLFEEALREASNQGARSLGYIARMEAGLASVMFERNDLDAAQQLVAAAIQHVSEWSNPNHLAYALVIQSRLLLVQQDLAVARSAILKTAAIHQNEILVPIIQSMIEIGFVRVWLAERRNNTPAPDDNFSVTCHRLIGQWQERLQAPGNAPDEASISTRLMLARVQVCQGQWKEALANLETVMQAEKRIGNIPIQIESLLLQSIASCAQLGSNRTAQDSFGEALRLGQAGGFVRIFLDEALYQPNHPVRSLIDLWLAKDGSQPLRAYALFLRGLVEPDTQTQSKMTGKQSGSQALPEPLSKRELEVLALIAEGLTNEALARRLVISAGTVKAHTATIYRKLDVANRTEAVARARQLNLLP
jgi:LuxR family maltose regulon positive regulatory protein